MSRVGTPHTHQLSGGEIERKLAAHKAAGEASIKNNEGEVEKSTWPLFAGRHHPPFGLCLCGDT